MLTPLAMILFLNAVFSIIAGRLTTLSIRMSARQLAGQNRTLFATIPASRKNKKKQTGFVLDFSYSVISPIQAYPLSLVNSVSRPLKSIHCSPSLIPPHSSRPHRVMCLSFFKKKKLMDLAVPGLSCSTQKLRSSSQHTTWVFSCGMWTLSCSIWDLVP